MIIERYLDRFSIFFFLTSNKNIYNDIGFLNKKKVKIKFKAINTHVRCGRHRKRQWEYIKAPNSAAY